MAMCILHYMYPSDNKSELIQRLSDNDEVIATESTQTINRS